MSETRPGQDTPGIRALVFLSIVGVAVGMFLTSPRHGEFWWSDAPRHALNAVFVRDLLAELPFDGPRAWAIRYYTQFPALTILFYPPLFYGLAAPFVALFGVTHGAVQAAVASHHALLGVGAYVLARGWFTWPVALLSSLLTMALPEMSIWGRQVMLEVPTAAFLVWSVVWWLRYERLQSGVALRLALLFLLAAMYTKLTAVFILPAFALHACFSPRRALLFRPRPVVEAAVILGFGVLPLVWLTMVFGQANVQSTSGIPDATVGRATIAGWLWYARQLPSQLTWPLLGAAAAGAVLRAFRVRSSPMPTADFLFILIALTVGYLFFSAIDLKESRHTSLFLFLVPPLAAHLVQWTSLRGTPVPVAIGFAFVAWSLATVPVPVVDGYRAVAELVAAKTHPGGVVLFSGKRDGSFIFSLRSLRPARDVTVLRSDKLLLSLAIRRELGYTELAVSQPEMRRMIEDYGVGLVVAQEDFWTDIPVMRRFADFLTSGDFEEIARFRVTANVTTEDKVIRVFAPRFAVAAAPPLEKMAPTVMGRPLGAQ